MITELCPPDYQRGWNDAHDDVTIKNLWVSMLKVKGSQDYIEGYHACQDNLLEERAKAREQNQ